MEICVSPRFEKNYCRLSRIIQQKAEKREKIFKKDPFDPRLETHKLHGELGEAWAYSVDNSYRIIFIFLDYDTVLYLDIGTHDIYK